MKFQHYFLLMLGLLVYKSAHCQRYEVMLQSGHAMAYGYSDMVTSLQYSDDGKYLVSGGGTGNTIIWDIATGRQVRQFTRSKNSIGALYLTPDNKYLFTLSGLELPVIYNVETGEENRRTSQQMNEGGLHQYVAYYDHSKNMALAVFDRQARLFNTKDWSNIAASEEMWENSPSAAAFSLEKKIIALGHGDGAITILSFPELKKLKSLPKHKKIKGDDGAWVDLVGFSKDGSTLVTMADYRMKVFDVNNNYAFKREIVMREQPKHSSSHDKGGALQLSHDGKFALCDLALWDLTTGEKVVDYNGSKSAAALSPDGKTIAIAGNSDVQQIGFYDFMTGRRISGINTFSQSYESSFDMDGNNMVVQNDQGLHLFDLKTGKKQFVAMEKKYNGFYNAVLSDKGIEVDAGVQDMNRSDYYPLKRISITPDGGTYKKINVNILGDGIRVRNPSHANGQSRVPDYEFVKELLHNADPKKTPKVFRGAFSPSGNIVLVAGDPPYEQYKKIGNNKIHYEKIVDTVRDAAAIFDLRTRQQIGYHEFPRTHTAGFTKPAAITDDGRFFFVNPSVYDAKTGQKLFSIANDHTSGESLAAGFLRDNKTLIVMKGDNSIRAFDVLDRKQVRIFNVNTGKVLDYRITADDNELFTLNADGSVQRWDIAKGTLVATYFAFRNENYAIVWHDNFYTMSPQAYKQIHFVKGMEAVGFDNFDLVFNRPDIIARRSGTKDETLINAYYKAYQKRLQKLGFSEAQVSKDMQLPELKITSENIPKSTNDASLEVLFAASGNGVALDRFNVYVNNVPLFGSKGRSLAKGGTTLTDKVMIPLSFGNNKIELSVHNVGGYESPRHVFNINREGSVKPDLYIVAIGVSDYKDNNYDLTYAAKDAQDLIKSYQSRKDRYGNITVLEFTDVKAIKENILGAKETLLKSKVDDQVVLFVAGHGLVDAKLDYYFATHDVNFLNPSVRGLPYEALEGLLDGIPARKKLMLIDACHSGEIDKEESQILASAAGATGVKTRGFKTVAKKSVGLDNSFDVMNEIFADLRRGTGAVVISSASGVEFAYESEQWKNGVFTYSILQAFAGYNYFSNGIDKNNSRELEVSELKDFVIENVIKLTNGKQHPTSRRENLEFDFTVW